MNMFPLNPFTFKNLHDGQLAQLSVGMLMADKNINGIRYLDDTVEICSEEKPDSTETIYLDDAKILQALLNALGSMDLDVAHYSVMYLTVAHNRTFIYITIHFTVC